VKKEKQMTVPPGTDASSDPPRNWKSINWVDIRQQVRRLQVRIAKATQLGKHRKVSALQWLLPPPASTRRQRLERLEPYEGKLSSTVLRGVWAGNHPHLPD